MKEHNKNLVESSFIVLKETKIQFHDALTVPAPLFEVHVCCVLLTSVKGGRQHMAKENDLL